VSHSPIVNKLHMPTARQPLVEEGWQPLEERILAACTSRNTATRIGIDGYLGIDWEPLVNELDTRLARAGVEVSWLDTRPAMLGRADTERIIASFLPEGESVFGRVCHSELSILFDGAKLAGLREKLRAADGEYRGCRKARICYGPGALSTNLAAHYHLAVYVDLTREEALKRSKAWADRKSRTQSVSPRRIYYVDFPLYDRHRIRALRRADLYVDGNQADNPKLLRASDLAGIAASLAGQPLRFKPLYEPGVWGGQWLKANRGLPASMPNCAYGFEIIAPEQSLVVAAGGVTFELPFNIFSALAGSRLISDRARRRFGGQFPVRISYDDTWGGGNLSIQVHPTAAYMRYEFAEPMHQAEMYYIFDAKPGSIVHLGLAEDADLAEFRREAELSAEQGRPFDHARHVNVVPARKGDILLIPPGTVHGAGADELVLEISSTPYRYTFKIYDYCRPDLDGRFRPLHLGHAFNVIKAFRTSGWVAENLVPRPRLLRTRSAEDGTWREYLLADRREFHHVVHRIEFSRRYRDDTLGRFHLLNLVEGRMVLVRSHRDPKRAHRMALSETLLVPRGVGEYEVISEAGGPCCVVKTLLRRE
jgi:mannose-6-phosphate isomerase class I